MHHLIFRGNNLGLLDIKSISLLGLYQQKLFAVEFFPNNYEENISFDSDNFCDFANVMR